MKKPFFLTLNMGRSITLLFMLLFACNAWGQQKWLPEHPRLLFTKSETAVVKQLIKTEPLAGKLSLFLKVKADSIIQLGQLPYQMDKYGNMLHTSRAYVFRLGTLSLAYRIYGDRKYLDAVNRTLLWVCNYPDWDPKHYLDTAEMTTAVAIAYDWLYHVLPQTTKNIVKKCLYKNALSVVLCEYEKGGPGSWAKRETNWNIVCNTGMVLGALAVAEDYPQEANIILKNAAGYMPNCLKHFAPDGVCYEGPAYWGYTNSYLSLYLKAVTDNGGDGGKIGQLPGISRTALFYKRSLTPSGQRFNFGNASPEEILNTPAFFFFSKAYRQPEITSWFRREVSRTIERDLGLHQLFFLALPWFDAAAEGASTIVPALEVYHNSINDLMVFNGNRNKKGSLFLIAKGGQPNQAHQQMDCGTFIVESDSVCWTEDLGADDYDLPGFWDSRPGGQRWKYFRNNNLSHNTINIDHRLQYANGRAFVCEEKTDISQPFVKLDMTSLYKEQAKSLYRKFTLLDDKTIEVEDDVTLLDAKSTLSWMVATKADVTIDGDKACLTRDGKRFYMKIIAPAQAEFKAYPAKNTFKGEKAISGVTMLEAECSLKNREGKVVVRMSSEVSNLQPFSISHGPYLQEVTSTGATFVFQTSAPSFSSIELKKEGSDLSAYYAHSEHGLKAANETFFSVRADDLLPNTVYQYRIHSKEMKSFQAYKVEFGDSIVSRWYTFRTVNPKQKGGSIFITSDMHSDPGRLKNLLNLCDYKTCTSFFYAGDMMNYMKRDGEHPFTSFIDASVDFFASSVPFELVRGNHETRGDMARIFPSFFPKKDGKIYGSYLLGDVMVIMLDSGEDKAENHWVYAGLTDFDAYRTEQAEWLEQVVKSKEYKKAKYKIVISHFPLVMDEKWRLENTWYGWEDACRKFLPVLNKADVDLVVSGHTHRFFYHEKEVAGNKFPVLEQGAVCATRLDLEGGCVKIKVVDTKGKILFEKKLSK